jgi:hypothetical protein
MCETNPIWLVGRGPRGRNVRNEPNFGEVSSLKCQVLSESCKTNPIPRLRIADSGQTCGGTPALRPAASSPRRPIVQNKANFTGRPGPQGRGTRGNCAKRTQFPATPGGTRAAKLRIFDFGLRIEYRVGLGPPGLRPSGRWPGGGCTNKPNLPPAGGQSRRGDLLRQTNPICAAPAVGTVHHSPIPSFQDSNSPARSRGAYCAKQSQFPAVPGGTGPQGRGTRGQSCETNPISRLWIADWGQLCGGTPTPCPALPPRACTRSFCETKPIRTEARKDQFGYRPICRRRR